MAPVPWCCGALYFLGAPTFCACMKMTLLLDHARRQKSARLVVRPSTPGLVVLQKLPREKVLGASAAVKVLPKVQQYSNTEK